MCIHHFQIECGTFLNSRIIWELSCTFINEPNHKNSLYWRKICRRYLSNRFKLLPSLNNFRNLSVTIILSPMMTFKWWTRFRCFQCTEMKDRNNISRKLKWHQLRSARTHSKTKRYRKISTKTSNDSKHSVCSW